MERRNIEKRNIEAKYIDGRYMKKNKDNIEIENIAAYALDSYIKENDKQCILVDVREKAKYDERHIEGAINISYRDMQAGKFDISKDKIIILYCDRGGLSMAAARYLSKQGYNVKNVVGGLKNYMMGKK